MESKIKKPRLLCFKDTERGARTPAPDRIESILGEPSESWEIIEVPFKWFYMTDAESDNLSEE